MSYIFPTTGMKWSSAKKTKPLQAKAMLSLIVDTKVYKHFLLDTLEGREPVGEHNIFCIGDSGDAWQQTSKALLKKYDVTNIDDRGWMTCTPKPENSVEFFQLEKSMLGMDQPEFVYIQGHYGENIMGIANLQRCRSGDYVCRQTFDHSDQWVVQKNIFENTYKILEANE